MVAAYSPPAFVDDLDRTGRDAWSRSVLRWFREGAAALPAGHRFFNLVDEAVDEAGRAVIPWNAFPRKFTLLWPQNVERRWLTTEGPASRDLNGRSASYYVPAEEGQWAPAGLPFRDQDEYCEWRSYRDPGTGRLERIVFSCENPEYWEFLAEHDTDLLVRLYRELVDPAVKLDDLLFQEDVYRPAFVGGARRMENRRGRYNPHNRWNVTDGIVHLTHPANSLQAEIHLAADATVLRVDGSGAVLTDDARLICCAAYGSPNRSSDPTIGGRVNELVRGGAAVTIDDPVGLYIGGIDLQPVEVPGGVDPSECWKIVRGDGPKRMVLRAEFTPPPGAQFNLEDVLVGGEPLRWGGQVAELITMVIHGRAVPRTDQAPSEGCGSKCCQVPDAPTLLTLADISATCPPSAAAPAVEIQDDGSLAVLAGTLPRTLAVEDLPDPGRRA